MIGIRQLLSLIILFALPAAAGAQTVSFQVEKATRAATLAQPFEIPLEIMHPNGYEVRLDSAALAEAGEFDIPFVRTTSNTLLAQNLVKESVVMTVIPFTLGATELPALKWKALDGMGTSLDFTSPALPVVVSTALPADLNKGELYDIAGPIKPFNWLHLFILLAILAVAAWLIRRHIRNRKLPPGAAQKADNRPLEVRINDEIDRLVASGLWESGKVKEFYAELSEIARRYTDARYGIDTTKLTTYELIKLLGKKNLDKIVITAVRKFLSACDLVKFAKMQPETAARDKDIAVLRAIIEDTTPQPVPPGTAGAADTPAKTAADDDFKDVAEILKKKSPQAGAADKGGYK